MINWAMAHHRSLLTNRSVTTEGLALAMHAWSSVNWADAFHHWSPEMLAAVVCSEGETSARVNTAGRTAIVEGRWDVVEDLFPHTAPNQVGEFGYHLLAFQSAVTLDRLKEIRPRPLDPLGLPRAILFRAAHHLDGDMVDRMIGHGASWTDQDQAGRTVIGIVARHLTASDLAQSTRAKALLRHWRSLRSALPMCDQDVRSLVSYGPSAWVLDFLSGSLPDPLKRAALQQAVALGRSDLAFGWLPALIRQAADETAGSRRAGPAHKALRGLLSTAMAGGADAAMVRQLWETLRPWCRHQDVEEAFAVAAEAHSLVHMELLWPHVRPAKVLPAAQGASRPVVDWILAHAPKGVRDSYLDDPDRSAPLDLPLALERQRVDRREEAAAAQAPARAHPRRRV